MKGKPLLPRVVAALAATALVIFWCAVIAAARAAVAAVPKPNPAMVLHDLAVRSLQGDASASFELAQRLDHGIGAARDPSEAAHWYQIAEEQGYPLPDDVLERLFP